MESHSGQGRLIRSPRGVTSPRSRTNRLARLVLQRTRLLFAALLFLLAWLAFRGPSSLRGQRGLPRRCRQLRRQHARFAEDSGDYSARVQLCAFPKLHQLYLPFHLYRLNAHLE